VACSDEELVLQWELGQQRAVDFAWRLGIKPPSLAHLTAVPADFAAAPPLAFANVDRWYLEPWAEEETALQQMRTADGDDHGHEAPMSATVEGLNRHVQHFFAALYNLPDSMSLPVMPQHCCRTSMQFR
jgi:hypothetical protein